MNKKAIVDMTNKELDQATIVILKKQVTILKEHVAILQEQNQRLETKIQIMTTDDFSKNEAQQMLKEIDNEIKAGIKVWKPKKKGKQ